MIAGLAESNGSLTPGDDLLPACTPGLAPGPTLGNEYRKRLFTMYVMLLLRCTVSFIDDCMTSSLTSHHVNMTSIHLTRDRGHVALYPGADTSRSDWTVSSCYWSFEAPVGRTIVVASKISPAGWTTTTSHSGECCQDSPRRGCISRPGVPLSFPSPFNPFLPRREAPPLRAGSANAHNTITQSYSKSIHRYLTNSKYINCPINIICRSNTIYGNTRLFLLTLIIA